MAGSPVIARNLAIAQREGLVSTARRWQSNAVLAMVVLALLAILVGWSAGRGALGDGSQPVNLFWALGALLGLNALTFIVWVLAMLFGHRSSGLIGRLVLAVAKRLTKLPTQPLWENTGMPTHPPPQPSCPEPSWPCCNAHACNAFCLAC